MILYDLMSELSTWEDTSDNALQYSSGRLMHRILAPNSESCYDTFNLIRVFTTPSITFTKPKAPDTSLDLVDPPGIKLTSCILPWKNICLLDNVLNDSEGSIVDTSTNQEFTILSFYLLLVHIKFASIVFSVTWYSLTDIHILSIQSSCIDCNPVMINAMLSNHAIVAVHDCFLT